MKNKMAKKGKFRHFDDIKIDCIKKVMEENKHITNRSYYFEPLYDSPFPPLIDEKEIDNKILDELETAIDKIDKDLINKENKTLSKP